GRPVPFSCRCRGAIVGPCCPALPRRRTGHSGRSDNRAAGWCASIRGPGGSALRPGAADSLSGWESCKHLRDGSRFRIGDRYRTVIDVMVLERIEKQCFEVRVPQMTRVDLAVDDGSAVRAGLAVDGAALDAAASQRYRPGPRPVIAAEVAIDRWRAAE